MKKTIDSTKVDEAKKEVTKEKKTTVKLVSYSIKMVIPTGAYANIQPEIVVKSGSIQEAHDFIAPHMNKLWKEYYLVNERRVELTQYKKEPVVVVPDNTKKEQSQSELIIETLGGSELGGKLPENIPSNIPGPDSSVALVKATQAIESCLSLSALELIQNQVIKSVKLSLEDKESLMPVIYNKSIKLSEGDGK